MPRILGLVATVWFGALMISLSAQSSVVSFTIDDSFSLPGGAGVFSDAAITGTNSYSDYRIDPVHPLNWCVDAEPFSAGNLFIRFNRKLDGDAGILRCDENPVPPGSELGIARQYTVRIADDTACDILADSDAGLPLKDAAGANWDAIASEGLCVLASSGNPRIRLDTLYKSKARTTKVDFLTFMFGERNSYEIRSDGAATIDKDPWDPRRKSISYLGTFRLVKFAPGVKARAVGPSFPMPVRMEFFQP